MLVCAAPAISLRGVLLAHDSRAANILAAQVDVALVDSHVATVRFIAQTHALKDLDISNVSRVNNGLNLSSINDHCANCDIAGLIIITRTFLNFFALRNLIDFHVSLFFDYEYVHLLLVFKSKPTN